MRIEVEEQIKLKGSATKLANSILQTNEDYLDKVLVICSIGQRIYGEAWNTEFHVFGAIASDTDHLPLKKTRELCSQEWFTKCDQELVEAISHHKQDVTKACNDILAKHQSVRFFKHQSGVVNEN